MLEIHKMDREVPAENCKGYVGKIIYFKDTKKAAYICMDKETYGDSLYFSWLENNLYVQIEYLIRSNEITLKDGGEMIFKKIKALSKPYKGAYVKAGNKKIRIWRADIE